MRQEVVNYVIDNPDKADNIEDMLNWTCEKFGIHEEDMVEEVFRLIRTKTDLT